MASIKKLDERRYKITVSNGYRPNGKKYTVAVFQSGTEDLYEQTHQLLLYNRNRAAELETKRQAPVME